MSIMETITYINTNNNKIIAKHITHYDYNKSVSLTKEIVINDEHIPININFSNYSIEDLINTIENYSKIKEGKYTILMVYDYLESNGDYIYNFIYNDYITRIPLVCISENFKTLLIDGIVIENDIDELFVTKKSFVKDSELNSIEFLGVSDNNINKYFSISYLGQKSTIEIIIDTAIFNKIGNNISVGNITIIYEPKFRRILISIPKFIENINTIKYAIVELFHNNKILHHHPYVVDDFIVIEF